MGLHDPVPDAPRPPALCDPPGQKGFIKNRFIFEHIWDARAAWEAIEYGLFLSIGFAKTFNLEHHNYFIAYFQHLGLPPNMISLIMTTLHTSHLFLE